MITDERNFVMVANNETQEVRQGGVLVPPVLERITARNILVRWHILIKEISLYILEEKHEPLEEVDTFKYTISEILQNVLRDVCTEVLRGGGANHSLTFNGQRGDGSLSLNILAELSQCG